MAIACTLNSDSAAGVPKFKVPKSTQLIGPSLHPVPCVTLGIAPLTVFVQIVATLSLVPLMGYNLVSAHSFAD
ncbi:hypothetical protein RB979_004218 [Vibrio alginolyticus]|nr:hypothetical protein [Vibrio alginolyticus]ELA6781934.1 hypothetical protein [Vibrio alginolyticus]ELB2852683.1 hypothetical protein [Vibrio alginolyticus]MBT0013460.1 hypothetical protein [Vibrio alginolyticus]MBT0041099.1 hypothetical protein [Vibrio alginolyticus]